MNTKRHDSVQGLTGKGVFFLLIRGFAYTLTGKKVTWVWERLDRVAMWLEGPVTKPESTRTESTDEVSKRTHLSDLTDHITADRTD